MFNSIKKLINNQLQEKEEKEMQERKEIQIDNQYCQKLKKEINNLLSSKKGYNKVWIGILGMEFFLCVLYVICYFNNFEIGKDFIKGISFPLIVFIITDWQLEKRRKIEKIDKLKEQFYTVAKPLYIKGKLDKDLEKFFEDEFLKNDDSSKDKCKKK